MTYQTHHHCQCDFCDGEDCKDLPKATHGELTTQELVDELLKREGVEYTEVLSPEKYWITQTDDDEAYDPLRGVGTVIILVVKK